MTFGDKSTTFSAKFRISQDDFSNIFEVSSTLANVEYSSFFFDIAAPRQLRLARRVTSGKGLKQRSVEYSSSAKKANKINAKS